MLINTNHDFVIGVSYVHLLLTNTLEWCFCISRGIAAAEKTQITVYMFVGGWGMGDHLIQF